jgi:hypothetical protein
MTHTDELVSDEGGARGLVQLYERDEIRKLANILHSK